MARERHYYLRPNDEEECWELLEEDAINDDGKKEDALIARFYDGNATTTPLGESVLSQLRASKSMPAQRTKRYTAHRDIRKPGMHWNPASSMLQRSASTRRVPEHIAATYKRPDEEEAARKEVAERVRKVFEEAAKRGSEQAG